MKLKVLRTHYSRKSIVGMLFINDIFFCHTLEDVSRDHNRDGDLLDDGETKIWGKTAIPSGRYQVVISFSNRFKKQMPEIINVPGFSGIRIHNGNIPEHTDGCLLVGNYDSDVQDFVSNSKLTFSKLMARLEVVAKLEKITFELIDEAAI